MGECQECLADAEATLDYVRRQAQEGCERITELRNATFAVLQTAGVHPLRPEMLRQLEVMVQSHARYLDVLRESVYLDWEQDAHA